MRKAEPKDCDIIAHHRYFTSAASHSDRKHYAQWVARALADDTYVGLFEEREGRVVAGIGLTILNWGPVRGSACSERGRVVNAFTALEWRNRGLCTALLGALLATGRARGIETFCLASTPESRRLYERAGFLAYEEEMRLMTPDRSV